MTNRSIYHNVYALLQKKYKHLGLLIFSLFFFVLFLKLLFLETVPLVGTYQSLYQCSKSCILELAMPVNDVQYFQKDLKVYVQTKEIVVQAIDFGTVEVIQGVPIQMLELEIPKQDWYNKQQIEIKSVLSRESIGKKILEVLRGGEADA